MNGIKCRCGKPIRQKKVIVTDPKKYTTFCYVCSEACARKLISGYYTKNQNVNYSSVKIFVSANNRQPLFNLMGMNAPANRKLKKGKAITKDEESDFKIDLGNDPDAILGKLLEDGEKFFEKSQKEK